VHDSTTITWLLAPELFRTVALPVRVETMGISKGKTWAAAGLSDFEAPWQNRRPVTIAVEVDGEKAVALELGRLAKLSSAPA
jgi:purine nucleosidase